MRPEPLQLEEVATAECFACGIDLFHAGYVWEAHEAWEHVWHQLADGSALESIVRAFIRTTAAHVKRQQGNERGVTLHRRGAQALVEGLPETLDFADLRIDVASFRAQLSQEELPRYLPVKRG